MVKPVPFSSRAIHQITLGHIKPAAIAPARCMYRHHIADFIRYLPVFDYN
jgi:hypothetical protein